MRGKPMRQVLALAAVVVLVLAAVLLAFVDDFDLKDGLALGFVGLALVAALPLVPDR
jgi:hypothetical protein